MSTELVGFLVAGPAVLDRSLVPSAMKHVETLRVWARGDEGRDEDEAEHILEALEPDTDVIDALFYIWSADSPAADLFYRRNPYDAETAIVFAGSGSSGEEPDGWGYQTLSRASYLGLFEIFGIC